MSSTMNPEIDFSDMDLSTFMRHLARARGESVDRARSRSLLALLGARANAVALNTLASGKVSAARLEQTLRELSEEARMPRWFVPELLSPTARVELVTCFGSLTLPGTDGADAETICVDPGRPLETLRGLIVAARVHSSALDKLPHEPPPELVERFVGVGERAQFVWFWRALVAKHEQRRTEEEWRIAGQKIARLHARLTQASTTPETSRALNQALWVAEQERVALARRRGELLVSIKRARREISESADRGEAACHELGRAVLRVAAACSLRRSG